MSAPRDLRTHALCLLVIAAACRDPSAKPPAEKKPEAVATATSALTIPLGAQTAAIAPAIAAPTPSFVHTGDLSELHKKGVIRFLIAGSSDYLARDRDPRSQERQLAEDVAKRMNLSAVFVPVAERDQLLTELIAGHGDVVVGSLTVTEERSKQVAFTRPIRFVKQVVVVKSDDTSITKVEDLAGKEVTVRPSSAYASSLKALGEKAPGLKIKAAGEREDTIDLLQKVARGEEKITVADSDIFAAALTFEPNLKAAVDLTSKDPIAWAIRKEAPQLKTALDTALIAAQLTSHQNDVYKADLAEIKNRRVLRVLTRNAANSYFLYRGEEFGFEYELAKEFAKTLGVRLEIVVPPTREALLTYLQEGRGDLVAAGLTITPERQKLVDFTAPYLKVSELVVVPASDTTTKEIADLKGKKISVRKSSSYFETLSGMKDKIGFEIALLPEDLETEDILKQVGAGKIAATVADSSIVDIELTYSDSIRSVGPLGEPVDIGWALRKDQPELKKLTDEFMKKTYRGLFYNMTVNKYFKNSKRMRTATSKDRSDKQGELSPYDALTKKYSKTYEMDWRLITSQMYQESRFDPAAKSWVGAQGLMQVMPMTAKDLKIADVVDPEGGIHAGVKLLARYAKMFEGPSVKQKDQLRLAMAAYNCGPGHVFDAQRLAKDMKLDPSTWFGNVEKAMVLLSEPKYAKAARHGYCRCSEPVKYVSEIQTRYDAYAKLVPAE